MCVAIYVINPIEENLSTSNLLVTRSRVTSIARLELFDAHILLELIRKSKSPLRGLLRKTNVMAELKASSCYAGFTRQGYGQHMYKIRY